VLNQRGLAIEFEYSSPTKTAGGSIDRFAPRIGAPDLGSDAELGLYLYLERVVERVTLPHTNVDEAGTAI
jgi:hypothetical protein